MKDDKQDDKSLDDLLAEAGKLMKQIGIDAQSIEEDEKKETEENADVMFEERIDEGNPFEDKPISVRKPEELTSYELSQLEEYYSKQNVGRFSEHGRMVDEVRSLSIMERAIFREEAFVTPQFNLQFSYKIKSFMDRRDIIANINAFFAKNPMLRVNFCMLGVDAEMTKIVFHKKEPIVAFTSLKFLKGDALNNSIEKAMSDDIQRPFDLQNDTLIRFSLIQGGKDYFALIVTMPRLISIFWNEMSFFEKVFDFKDLPKQEIKDVEQPFSLHTANYYLKLLKHLPPVPQLPRFKPNQERYTQNVHQIVLPKELSKLLAEKSVGKRDVMISILATAWGLMLKQVNLNRDTYFSILLSEHVFKGNPALTASKIYPLPLRITIDDKQSVEKIVGRLTRQLLTSKSLACTKMRYVLKDVGDPKDLFLSLLHFHGFCKPVKKFEDAVVGKYALLNIDAVDAGKNDLNVYFDVKKEGVAITFRYNPYAFQDRSVAPLAKFYEVAIACLLLTFDQDISLFEEIFNENIQGWDKSMDGYTL